MRAINKFREWQKENPEWQLICDMSEAETDALYTQWNELSKAERMYWVGKHRDEAREAFEEFGLKKCKVPKMVLDFNLQLHEITDWPNGEAMTVFLTGDNHEIQRIKDR